MGGLLAWVLRQWGDWVPMERITESEHLQAFYHPQPSYVTHILIIPKEAIPTLLSLKPDQTYILEELMVMVRALVEEFGLESSGFRLIVNGGTYQEITQLHFHLVSDSQPE